MATVDRDPGREHGRAGVPAVPELGLALGGALTAGMALYHFYLPYAFHWGDALARAPMLRWVFLGFSVAVTLLYLPALVPGSRAAASSVPAPPALRILDRGPGSRAAGGSETSR